MLTTCARQLSLGFALLIAPSSGLAQKPSVIPLIPTGNWRLVSSQKVELNAVQEWGSDLAIEREYGVKSVIERAYDLDGNGAKVLLEQATDASSAYGLLTFYQTEMMKPEKDLPLTVSGSQGALMARGPFFMRVARPGNYPLSDADFRTLLVLLGGMRSSAETTASLPQPLPSRGLVPCSEKYLLGLEAARRVLPSFPTDLIGFAQGAEAQVASYRTGPTGSTRASLLLVNYPTPQIARIRFGAMGKFLDLNRNRGADSLYGKRQGSFVLIVLNSDLQATATKLLEQFTVSEQVSWDQRYPSNKPITLQVLELILANMMLVMILVGFGVVGGVLIFVFKRLAAKWFPQSPWAHPEEEIIRLKL